ncbi:MAG: prepilin-type N-terminal cleavage/methylation domain-containing protein [Acidobacteriota bacterium]
MQRSGGSKSVRSKGQAGFTILEMVVVVVIILVLAAIGWPALHKMMLRQKLHGLAQETAMQMQSAKLEAIKRGVPAVMRVDFTNDEIMTFVDFDNSGTLNPVGGARPGETDFVIQRRPLPETVFFWGPADAGEEGPDVVNGFTAVPSAPAEPRQAVFEPDGSIRDVGAYRFADPRGNYLEVIVQSEASALVRLRKWDGTAFREAGEGGKAWKWSM